MNSMKQIKTNSNNHLKLSRTGFPSPVPTGKGLRSSALNDEILSDYLTTSLQIPALKLPIAFQSRRLPTSTLAIDFQSVLSGNRDTVDCVISSASEYGFFTISGHGISVMEAQTGIAKNGGVELGERRRIEAERFSHCWAGEEDGSEINPNMPMDTNLRKCLETIEAGLFAVGKSLGEIFSEHESSFRTIQGTASPGLAILNCNVDYKLSKTSEAPSNEDENGIYCKSALDLYLPLSRCDVLVQVGTDSFVLEAGPDNIMVILGQQLEVDGSGHLKNVPIKLRFVSVEDDQNSTSSHPLILAIGINAASRLNQQHPKWLSIYDQIIVVALTVLLFQLALWILL